MPEPSSEPCATRLKILADPTRLQVIQILVEGPLSVGELVAHLGIEPSLLSHHLRVLREGGLVESTRQGKSIHYRLASSVDTESADGVGIDFGCCRLTFEAE